MKFYILVGLVVLLVQQSVAPPVKEQKETETNEVEEKEDLDGILEYHKYLNEVVQTLENDPEFRAKLEKADEKDIRSGKIAEQLEFVSHNVRTQLDELKRRELNRLREIAMENYRKEIGLSSDHMNHLNHHNPHTFEIDDLKKLIEQTTSKLSEADKRRREEFKEYEMHKKFEQEESLKGNNGLSEEERKAKEKEIHDMEEKHKKHEPLHHPGSKQQLEEVWVKQDHMENQDFDPKTFFAMHDLDGNNMWDEVELKALFIKELDKLYQAGHPEDDLRERAEEMERMREHVFNEADKNKDGLISLKEFLEQSSQPEFQNDDEWQTLDKQQIYSNVEYETYRQNQIAQGMHHQPDLDHHQQMPQHVPQQFPSHHDPNQVQFRQGVPPPPQYQQHPAQGHVPPQQQYQHHPAQGQVPSQQIHHGQVPPQQQVHHGQVPPQYHPQPGHDQYQQQQPQYHQQQPQYQGVPQQQHQVPPQHQQVPQYQQVPPQHQQQVPPQHQEQVPPQHQQVPPQHQQVPPQHQQQVPPQHQQIPAGHQVPSQQFQQQPPQQQQPVPGQHAPQPGVAANQINTADGKPADHKPIPHVPVPQTNQHPPSQNQPVHNNEPHVAQV